MPSGDQWDALYQMAGSSDLTELKAASDKLGEIRGRFAAIHDYYFPQSWLVSVKRSLRLADPPDYERHLTELKDMHDQARQIMEQAKTNLEAIPKEKVSRQFRQLAELTHRQIHFDGSAIVAMYEFLKAKKEQDQAAARHAIDLEGFLHKAQENAARLRTWRLDFEESTLDPSAWDTEIPR